MNPDMCFVSLLCEAAPALPSLQHLHLRVTNRSMIQAALDCAPALTSLTRTAKHLASLTGNPISTLGSCKNLHIRLDYPSVESDTDVSWIQELVNLRSLSCRSNHAALAPIATFCTLSGSDPWHSLATRTALRSLNLTPRPKYHCSRAPQTRKPLGPQCLHASLCSTSALPRVEVPQC